MWWNLWKYFKNRNKWYIYDKENNINDNNNKELNLEKILEDLFERNITKSEEENGCDNLTTF